MIASVYGLKATLTIEPIVFKPVIAPVKRAWADANNVVFAVANCVAKPKASNCKAAMTKAPPKTPNATPIATISSLWSAIHSLACWNLSPNSLIPSIAPFTPSATAFPISVAKGMQSLITGIKALTTSVASGNNSLPKFSATCCTWAFKFLVLLAYASADLTASPWAFLVWSNIIW